MITAAYFFEDFKGFSLDDIYYSLDIIARNQSALQKWIFDHSGSVCERDLSVSYFDCTNYYFDIGRPDVDTLDEDGDPVDKEGNKAEPKYRKRTGKKPPSRSHCRNGTAYGPNGIPLAYDLFPGNESEKVHMRPIINRVKRVFRQPYDLRCRPWPEHIGQHLLDQWRQQRGL